MARPEHREAETDLPAAIREAAVAWKTRADAGLEAADEARLQAWLEADPRHRAAMARFDLVWDKFDRPFQAGATDELLQALELRARRRRRRYVSAAAGLCVLLAAVSVWRLGPNERPRGGVGEMVAAAAAPATSAVLLLPARQVLPDGSVAELRAGAQIAVEFSANLRRVVLRRGEAHFHVTKDAARPFVVAAGGVEARAVGTAFTVQLSATAVEVLVTEGRVAVNHAVVPPPAPAAPVVAAAIPPAEPLAVLDVGTSIVVELAPHAAAPPQVTAVPPAEVDERLAWRAPRVEFTRTQLAEAVAVLNGYSAGRRAEGLPGVQFIIDDPALAGIRVSGLFRIDRTDAFVGVLRSGFGLEAAPRGEGELVLRRAR